MWPGQEDAVSRVWATRGERSRAISRHKGMRGEVPDSTASRVSGLGQSLTSSTVSATYRTVTKVRGHVEQS